MLLSIHRPDSVDRVTRTTSDLFEALGSGKELFRFQMKLLRLFAPERWESSARERLSNLFWFFWFFFPAVAFRFLEAFL